MEKRVTLLSLLFAILLPFLSREELLAQNDPALAGMILLYTDKAKKELKQQESMMLMESAGHIWITDEMNKTTDLQKEFNKYLDEFHGIITYAAEIYGFYYEIDKMVENLNVFNRQLGHQTANAISVSLSSRRNQIYRDLIMGSIDIVNDIRQVCFSNNKMTEKERVEVVFRIRPKLKRMNQQLRHLIKAVKYTSMTDVWAEIDYHARSEADKKSITRQSLERWRRNGLKR